MCFLSGNPIIEWSVQSMGNETLKDKVTINLIFKDGSLGSIHYLANGSKRFPKERVEVFCGGSIIQLDNFRKMKGFGWPRFNKMNLWRQDKGHNLEIQTFLDSVRFGKQSPISIDELIEETRITIEIANSL
jgi:predicted dehydrogenase